MISVRLVQKALGVAYAVLALVAVARAPSLTAAVIAVGLLAFAYLTGPVLPDARIPSDQLLRVCGLGLVVLAAGVIVDVAGEPRLRWAAAVMAYCAGNRLKAGGIGSAKG